MTPFLLLSAAGGALMWAAFPPLDWGPIAVPAVAALLWSVRRTERLAVAALHGLVFGLFFFVPLLYWLVELELLAWLPLSVMQSLFMVVFAVVAWAFRYWPPARWWLVVTATWGLLEFLRGTWPLGGFSWGSLGVAIAGVPGFIGATQWIGPIGWSLIAVAVAAGLVLVVEDTENWRLVVDPLVVGFLLMLGGGLFPPSATGPELDVAVVQGGTPCPQVHCPDENRLIFESHLALTREIPAGTVDLVVWPENSLGTPYDPISNMEVRAALEGEARRLGAYLLVSGTEGSEDTFLNVNYFFGPTGSLLDQYRKRHPVPFGEYVPARRLFSVLPAIARVPRDMERGEAPVVFVSDQGQIGSLISFEAAFTRYYRDTVVAGAQVIVVPTNESSYGHTPAADQLIDLASVNAAAVGQNVVIAAITGKSAFISPAGAVLASTDLFVEETLTHRINYQTGAPTIYTRYGEWALIAALAAAAIALILPGRGKPQQVLSTKY